jgi:hypothetical protein
MKELVGLIGIVLLFPLFLMGLGEVAMGLPVVGVCMATLAAIVLRSSPRRK